MVITLPDDPQTTEFPTDMPTTMQSDNLKCWTCDGRDPQDCLDNGRQVTCQSNQESCQIEVRKRKNQDGSYDFIQESVFTKKHGFSWQS